MMSTVRPPGPTGVPLFGSLLEAWQDPLAFASRLGHEYGELSSYRIGTFTGYLVNHPEHVQYVLQRNHRNYSKQNYHYKMLKPVLGDGLLTSDGDHWLRERRLIQPVFQPGRITRFGPITTNATANLINEWGPVAADGEVIDIADEMVRLTLLIVGESLFGAEMDESADVVARAFSILNHDVAFRLRTVFVPPLWVPTPRNLKFKRARAELDRLVYEIVANRRRTGEQRTDLLAMLLEARDEETGEAMDDRQLRDEVMTLLLAGHETTANLLAWTMYLIATNPETEATLRIELDDVFSGRLPQAEDLRDLEQMALVVHESLRLYPPVWIVSRTAIDDDEIAGYPIPAGTTLAISPYVLHRHSDFWEDPEQFRPERFTREASERRHRYAYIPFGGGPRYCVGSTFAMMEAQLILAMILQKYRFELTSDPVVEPEALVTLRPRHGIKMTLHPV